MPVLSIVTGANQPVLRSKCIPVVRITKDIKKLVQDMKVTMHYNHGIGLAAPQVGEGVRVIVYEYRPEGKDREKIPFTVLINPVIYWYSKVVVAIDEGCLSLPDLRGVVSRPESIRVRGMNEQGKRVDYSAKGMHARIILHEVDHLDGVLFIDYLKPSEIRILEDLDE